MVLDSLSKSFDGFMLTMYSNVNETITHNIAIATITDTLGDNWQIQEILPDLNCFFVSPSSDIILSPSDAFNLARQLKQQASIKNAIPLFEQPLNDRGSESVSSVSITTSRRLPCLPPYEVDDRTTGRYEWALEGIKVQEAWNLAPLPRGKRYGEGVRIGHPDTGYTQHPEIIDGTAILPELGQNYQERNTTDPQDPLSTIDNGHGTATASVIISPVDRQLHGSGHEYVRGVAPKAELIPTTGLSEQMQFYLRIN